MESKFKNLISCEPAHNYAKPRNIYFHILDSNIDDIEIFYSKCIEKFFKIGKNAGWRRNNVSRNIYDFFGGFDVMSNTIKNFFSGPDILANIDQQKWSVVENPNIESINDAKYLIFTLSNAEEVDSNYKMFMFSFVVKKYPTIEYFEKTINELHTIIEYQHNIIEDMNKAINDISRKMEN
jgi:hypothetical protein